MIQLYLVTVIIVFTSLKQIKMVWSYGILLYLNFTMGDGNTSGDGEAYDAIEDTDGYIICGGGQPYKKNNTLCNQGIGPNVRG